MYALASLGLRRSAGDFCVAGVGLGALQGVGCTPWRPLLSAALPVAFAWQVRVPEGFNAVSKHVYAHAYVFILKAFCFQEIW